MQGNYFIKTAANPYLTGALLGAGIGGTWGLINEMLRDPKERNYALGVLPYMIGGGALGLGVGGLVNLLGSGEGGEEEAKVDPAIKEAARRRQLWEDSLAQARSETDWRWLPIHYGSPLVAIGSGAALATAGTIRGLHLLGTRPKGSVGRNVARFLVGTKKPTGSIRTMRLSLPAALLSSGAWLYDKYWGVGGRASEYYQSALEKSSSFNKLKLLKKATKPGGVPRGPKFDNNSSNKTTSTEEGSSSSPDSSGEGGFGVNPMLVGGLAGAGLGGLAGLISEWWKDEEDRNWWNAVLPAMVGGIAGAGIGGLWGGSSQNVDSPDAGKSSQQGSDKTNNNTSNKPSSPNTNNSSSFSLSPLVWAVPRHALYYYSGKGLGKLVDHLATPPSITGRTVTINPYLNIFNKQIPTAKVKKGITYGRMGLHGLDSLYTLGRMVNWW